MTRRRWQGVAAIAVVAVAAVAVAATAVAATHGARDRNNRGTSTVQAKAAPVASAATMRHLSLAASAFAPDHIGNPANDYFNNWDPSTLSDTGNRCFNVGISLPNGATIRSVTWYYTRGTSGNTLFFELNRQNLPVHRSKVLASFRTTAGTTATFTHKVLPVAASGKVVTSTYAYSLGVCPEGDATFTGVTVNFLH